MVPESVCKVRDLHGLWTVLRVLPAGSRLKSSTSSGLRPSAEQGVPGQSRGPGPPGCPLALLAATQV